MFTIEDIKAAHAKVKSGADFPQYIRDLHTMGVAGYTTYVQDGRTNYKDTNGDEIISPAKYNELVVADSSDAPSFKAGLKEHQQGNTDYPTFCKMCADTGVEKWMVSIDKMTCTYFDKAGNILLEENIPG